MSNSARKGKGLGLGFKLAGSFAVVIVLAIVMALVAVNSMRAMATAQEEIAEIMELAVYQVEKEVDHLDWTNQLANSFILMVAFGGQLDYTQCDFGQWYYAFRDSPAYRRASPAFRSAFDAIEEPHRQLHGSATRIVQLVRDDQREAAVDIYRNQTLSHLADVRRHLDALKTALGVERDQVIASSRLLANRATVIQLLVTLLVVLLSLALATLIVRSITRPMAELTERAAQMAEGDFTGAPLRIHHADEIGLATSAFNDMSQRIGQLVREVNGSISRVASAAEELSAVTRESDAGVRRQQQETDQVATAMHEMSATVQEVARNTQGAAEAAHNASDQAAAGKAVVSRTIDTIESLANEVGRAAEVISHLHENTQEINKVLEVIRDIAEQTNLLALNAAIEAARAGEQGRGFAVVADEVRTLATRTHESTREIQQMIEQLQDGANQAVEVMNASSQRAGSSVTQAAEAGGALDAITEAVSNINDMNTQIASASEEQSAVAEEINRNITNISQIAEQNATASEQTMGASQELARLAEELNAVAGRFRV